MAKRALITGITGQVGRYLSDLLIEKGYEVHGIKRRVSYPMPFEIDNRINLHTGDLGDSGSLERIIREIQPNEIYNLAAMSDVQQSFTIPEYTGDVGALGVVRLLEAARIHAPNARIFQAGTSEMYGSSPPPQNEKTRFNPMSPYAIAKLYGYHTAIFYRNAYGMFVSNGILFNHESRFRGHQFVTRKITRGLARINAWLEDCLYLGNLDARRDWGHAEDYARAQWLMLQHSEPDDFVIATGEMRTVRDFATEAADHLGIQLEWRGSRLDEVAVEPSSGKTFIKVDESLFRPIEVERLRGDANKAYDILGWKPEISFEDLVEEMVYYDMQEANMEMRKMAWD